MPACEVITSRLDRQGVAGYLLGTQGHESGHRQELKVLILGILVVLWGGLDCVSLTRVLSDADIGILTPNGGCLPDSLVQAKLPSMQRSHFCSLMTGTH